MERDEINNEGRQHFSRLSIREALQNHYMDIFTGLD